MNQKVINGLPTLLAHATPLHYHNTHFSQIIQGQYFS